MVIGPIGHIGPIGPMTTGGDEGGYLLQDKKTVPFSPDGTAGREGRRILGGSKIRRQSFLSFQSFSASFANSSEAGER